MFSKILLFLVGSALALFAEPSIAQIKAAVSANPSLLNTPQAQAAMKDRGITSSDIKAKLNKQNVATSQESVTQKKVENKIETTEKTETQQEIEVGQKISSSTTVNPFAFQSNQSIQKLNSKKQQHINHKKLSRYATKFFNNKNLIDSSSLPTPDNYIITNKDQLVIYVYGDKDKTFFPVVNNDGTIKLPFVGPLHIGGMSFKEAKSYLQKVLKQHFQLSSFYINMQKYSTIQVTLIGDVTAPGLYNIPSFSTLKDLLIRAKGINSSASLRDIEIKRNGKIYKHIDLYKFFFQTHEKEPFTILQHGDVIILHKAPILVSIDGYVNTNAIFELTKKETLQDLLQYARGLKPNASKTNITIQRFENNNLQKTFTLSLKETKKFKLFNGDKVYVYPLDFTTKASISIYGNIIRPGNYPLPKDKLLNTLLKEQLKHGMEKFFLPKTYLEYGVIKRYNNLKYTTLSFNLNDIISNKVKLKLYPQDKLYIFSQSDIFSNSYITTKGDMLKKAGKLQFFEGMTLQDAINTSGINGFIDDMVKVTSFNSTNFMPETKFYSLKKDAQSVFLHPYDEVEVFSYYKKHNLQTVSIYGEVLHPGSFYFEENLTVKKLIDIAGGLTKKAYTKYLSIIRYYIDEKQQRQQKVLSFDLSKTTFKDIQLQPYDEVKIYKILGWDNQDFDTISISGEVHNSLTTKYSKGMTVHDLIILAGGLTKKAYLKEIEIIRHFVDEDQIRQRKVLHLYSKDQVLENIKLQPYDEVKFFTIPKWNEQKFIFLKGEVKFPGKYAIETGEKLSSIIQRAGGFTKNAFIEGAVFTRESVRQNQIEQYNKTLARIKRQLAIFNAMPANAKNAGANGNALATINEIMAEAKKYQPLGRVSIKLSSNINEFQNSPYDLTLQKGDTLTIPSQIDTVTVFGEVFNPTSFIFQQDLDALDYIDLASGFTRGADEDRVYIIHADGTSEPAISSFLFCDFYENVHKGDTVVVPMYIKEYNQMELWEGVSKILASFAITAATLQTLGVF